MITLDRNALRDCVKDAVREELQVFISKVGNMDDPPQKKQPTKLMTKKEMANELDISLVSLTEWMKQGRIPYKRMGKRIYFNKEDVMASMTNFNHNKGVYGEKRPKVLCPLTPAGALSLHPARENETGRSPLP